MVREISPAEGISADEFLRCAPDEVKRIVAEIRQQKLAGLRPGPSRSLIDRSAVLTTEKRSVLLDKVATLVDENLCGRSEMCMQFAALLDRALSHLKLRSRAVLGVAMYFSAEAREIYRWEHAWVRLGEEIIDANVDSLSENPVVPVSVKVAPYWGPIAQMPKDRRLREKHGAVIPPDNDVSEVWWPELRYWLDAGPLV